MEETHNRTAVITGAAEGIGRALARKASALGMRLVLADIDGGKLDRVVDDLAANGTAAVGMRTDVSREEQVEALATLAYDTFGAVHLLVNNAGVALAKNAWETTRSDWDWVMGVNLYGVTNGLRAFIPRMLASGEEAHVVNTASVAGLLSEPSMAAYNVSKFGVVTLSEGLHHDLTLRNARIRVSVLCPAWVKTRIAEAERHRPAGERIDLAQLDSVTAATGLSMFKAVQAGAEPEEIAEAVFDAIRDGRFYIITHPETRAGIRIRMEDILGDRQPTLLPL
ncbi:MAG TPA: SDR family NAD(P)-dependent oxidoreductase [Geobacteraceae bacterium]